MNTIHNIALVRQSDLRLFGTNIPAKILIDEEFCTAQRLNENTGKGHQRALNEKRARELAGYILDSRRKRDGVFPSSIFLATESPIEFNEEKKTISFDLEEPFRIVDGQHRIAGFRFAKEEIEANPDAYPDALEYVLNFEMPVVIAGNLSEFDQMQQFRTVNTKHVKIDANTVQSMDAWITRHKRAGGEHHTFERSLGKIVEEGKVLDSVDIVKFLNTHDESPLNGRFLFGGEKRRKAQKGEEKDTRISASTLSRCISQHILKDDFVDNKNALEKKLLNYWKAVKQLLDPDGKGVVLYQSNGLKPFTMIYRSVEFRVLERENGGCTVENFKSVLKKGLDGVDGDYHGIGEPWFWEKGSEAHQKEIGSTVSNKVAKAIKAAL